MTKKLEIIGPYTPDHDGPYAIQNNDSFPIQCHVHSVVEGTAFVTSEYMGRTPFLSSIRAIMNAREVRVPHEVWVNEYEDDLSTTHRSLEDALSFLEGSQTFTRTIHVREVLEGEEA